MFHLPSVSIPPAPSAPSPPIGGKFIGGINLLPVRLLEPLSFQVPQIRTCSAILKGSPFTAPARTTQDLGVVCAPEPVFTGLKSHSPSSGEREIKVALRRGAEIPVMPMPFIQHAFGHAAYLDPPGVRVVRMGHGASLVIRLSPCHVHLPLLLHALQALGISDRSRLLMFPFRDPMAWRRSPAPPRVSVGQGTPER